jgi:subtilisin family serine protease
MAAELGIPATFPPLAAADELASCAPLAETSAAALQQGLAACTVGIDADLHDDALETFTFDASPPPVETQDARGWTDIDSIRSTYGFRGAGQTVAVIDSGIAYDHYALGRGFGAGSKVVGGWDFAENDSNPYDDGPAGYHGTHVAGVIGSTDASYTGIAPGVDLVALRVFDDQGKSKFAWVESALQWVHAHRSDFASPITTVNLSIGAVYNSNVLPDWAMLEDEFAQLKADGIVVTVAAGNHFSKFNVAGLSYPAVSPDVIPAMAVNSAGARGAGSVDHEHRAGLHARQQRRPQRLQCRDGNEHGLALHRRRERAPAASLHRVRPVDNHPRRNSATSAGDGRLVLRSHHERQLFENQRPAGD